MTKLAANEFHTSSTPCNPSRGDMSRCKTLDRSDVLYLNPAHSAEFREWFAPMVAQWLKERFANPEQVAAAFSVRNSTAWNWWNGDNRASGDAVARIFMAFPEAAVWFRQHWEAR
ncbi:hypothetical protein [uncultured Roseobacter sp.]|uniref:hypothetical protein n=1 Tax=uncultured Roseobacter sp. TaxID=114847 RepID=UPI002612DC71|nr:hypothetical protein [uncultured Roseobacter sp.]